ncbi:MAG: M24 family metallopeptidase [Pseudomonadota bacterium]
MPHRLDRLDWPDFGAPDVPAPVSESRMRHRLFALRDAVRAADLDCLVIYGDREHAANIHWATGFDPRFEEALLILPSEGRPVLAAGNECLPYTRLAPLVAAGEIDVAHCPGLSLISQPRDVGERIDAVLRRHVPAGARVGTAGWKYWEPGEVDDPAHAVEIPALLADVLRGRARGGVVRNATDLLMHPGYGLRSVVAADDIARLEFANAMAARAVRRILSSLRVGMTDFEAVEAGRVGGLPLGCHVTFATGAMAAQGLSGPSGQRIALGNPLSFNICHWGANVCRSGWLARDEADLPSAARGYVASFAGPYVEAMSLWLSMMRPGVSGGDVWAAMASALPRGIFGVTLNPGHLIGLDEWISSPIFEGSTLPLRSGMAMQCDIIPAHPVFGSVRMEDGYVIAGPALRADLHDRFPDVAGRCAARRSFMRERLGFDVPECLLPLADTCGIVPPFLLAPDRVVLPA